MAETITLYRGQAYGLPVGRWWTTQRRKYVESFERLVQSTFPPFADADSPYTYRAFDLRDDYEQPYVILFTDIHT